MAVAIVVGDSNAQAFPRNTQTNLLADFGEAAVPIIVIDQRPNSFKGVGMAVGAQAFFVLAAPEVAEIPLQVTEHNQVETAVVIEVHPGGAGGPSDATDPACCVTSVKVPLPLLC